MRNRMLALCLVAGLSCLSAAPLATVTSGGDFNLNGKRVQTTGAPNWPVSAGDEVVSTQSRAVLTFPDGSRLTLAPQTKVVLQRCDRCVAQLFQGSAAYEKAAGSNFELCVLGHSVKPDAGTQGTVTVVSPEKVVWNSAGIEKPLATTAKCACNAGAPWGAAGMSAAKKAAIVTGVAAGGTAATVTGIAVSRSADKSTK